MKKIHEKGIKMSNAAISSVNDEIFDPEDNLYNNPDDTENLTFSMKNNRKSNPVTFSKNLKKDRNFEK